MKKFLVVLVILAVAITAVFAEPVSPETRDLKFFGVIEVGERVFKIVKTSAEDVLVINLIEDEDVQPGGDGVRIGAWAFSAINQNEEDKFVISYEKTPLTSENGASYAYEIIEIDEGEQDGYDKYVGEGGLISFDEGGEVSISQGIAVRLVSAIPSGAAPGVFEGNIKVILTAN